MNRRTVVGIGPLSPPITGPGLKNRYLKDGLEAAGYTVEWVDTLNLGPGTFVELFQQARTGTTFVVSASTKVRFGVATVLARRLARGDVRGVLLPAGGAFADEIRGLPPVLRSRYLDWFGRFDWVLPESTAMSKDLATLFGDRTQVAALPNLRPVPETAPPFEPFAGADRPLRIVYVGRIKKTKGLDLLLSAVSRLNADGERVTFDAFGHFLPNDPYEAHFKQACAATPGATFGGKLPDGTVIDQLRAHDAFVFPTYYEGEGYPGALLEAFAAGCLVVASDWNYNGELVTDGEDGLLFAPRDVDDLTAKLEWLLEHPAAVDSFRRRSWEKASQYSVERITDELSAYLRGDAPPSRPATARASQQEF